MADTQLTTHSTDCIILGHFVLILFWYRIHNSFALADRGIERDRKRWTHDKHVGNLSFRFDACCIVLRNCGTGCVEWFVDMYAIHTAPFNLHPHSNWHVSGHSAYFVISLFVIHFRSFKVPMSSYECNWFDESKIQEIQSRRVMRRKES